MRQTTLDFDPYQRCRYVAGQRRFLNHEDRQAVQQAFFWENKDMRTNRRPQMLCWMRSQKFQLSKLRGFRKRLHNRHRYGAASRLALSRRTRSKDQYQSQPEELRCSCTGIASPAKLAPRIDQKGHLPSANHRSDLPNALPNQRMAP
mmetsp:Transcript_10363/g.13617  ORF Transcript_10363/g.13617 Transcript_10363/m.13617 type:complete len:147 (+) Transcript_10363:216-656(+)